MSTTMTTTTTSETRTASAEAGGRGATARGSFLARAWVIGRREMLSYFVGAIAYVVMVLFLVACGIAFSFDFDPGRPAMMRHVFEWMLWFLACLVPLLCMGSISQEWSNGTIETLTTAPVTDTEVVLGKFFGSMGFVLLLLAPTVLYVIVLKMYSSPSLDMGPVLNGYLGMILAGALFVAISLFCSSLTRSQVVAAVSAFAILACLTILPWLSMALVTLPRFWRWVANQTIYARYADFSKGVLDLGHIVFFVMTTVVFLFVTVKVLESRRWK